MSTRVNVDRDDVTAPGPPEEPTRLPEQQGRLAVFDLDRTLLPGSSLSLFGRALHRAGMVGSRRMAGYFAREAVFVRRGQGTSAAHRLLAALLADVADREAGPLLDVAEGLGDDLARTARPGARWLLDRHLDAGDFCLIASPSPQPLVEAAARPLGAHRAGGTRPGVCDRLWPAPAPAAGISWTDQFGTRYPDEADGMAADADGNLYVAGQTSGELPGQKAAGMIDAFVRRLDPAGHEVWTRQFGSPERDEPKGMALDDTGNVYVVGQTFGSLPGQTSAGGWDAFIRKYDRSGDEVW